MQRQCSAGKVWSAAVGTALFHGMREYSRPTRLVSDDGAFVPFMQGPNLPRDPGTFPRFQDQSEQRTFDKIAMSGILRMFDK